MPNEGASPAEPVTAGKPQDVSGTPAPQPAANVVSGSVQALRDLRRELTEDDLKNPGVVKLILDRLDAALTRCAGLETYRERFHEADKEVAVLSERTRSRTALDIAWGGGVAVGAMCVGLAPGLWSGMPTWAGPVVLAVGIALIALGVTVRAALR
jgi:hypothetical protein